MTKRIDQAEYVIATPRGKRMTRLQYLALYRAKSAREEEPPPCTYGHYGCAVWADGPCFDEQLGDQEEVEELER